ncbi:MAG: KpsF/GutQ family sugar-phosphate isomerase [Candidatus Omnitrophica bacterium]|nr:KpsF/GutQ family sugar-phosphate isomerase [Candidatus Omnitrophota bacterium]
MTRNRAREVLDIEAKAVSNLKKRINKNFERVVDYICKIKGKVIVTGMGKPGFIAQKISATLSSTGTPSLYLHPAEALHGDLGRVTKDDCIIAFSNSGETEEMLKLLPIIKKIGVKLICFCGNKKSSLAKNSDFVVDTSVDKEACSLGLAPTASTTAMLAMGDALAVALLEKKGFREKDFAFYHPGGILGKRLLLKVEDIMRRGRENPIVKEETKVKKALLAITRARAGSASIIDKRGRLTGIFTDGDLRRHIDKDPHITNRKIKDVMTKNPTSIKKDRLAAEAFQILKQKKIDEVPVVDAKNRPIGLLDVQDLLKAGLV